MKSRPVLHRWEWLLLWLMAPCALLAAETTNARPWAPVVRQRSEHLSQNAALRWLKQQQNQDGSWTTPPNDLAGSGLAILAFLKRGETPESKEFGDTVSRGLIFLVQALDEQGWVKGRDRDAQAVVTLALTEAYAMTQASALRQPLVRALKLNAVRWTEADGFELVWLTLGIVSARSAGLEVPVEGTRTIRERLWDRQQADGQFTDGQGRAAPEFTGAYVYSLQLLAGHRDPRLKLSLDWLKQQRLDWRESTAGHACESWILI